MGGQTALEMGAMHEGDHRDAPTRFPPGRRRFPTRGAQIAKIPGKA